MPTRNTGDIVKVLQSAHSVQEAEIINESKVFL